MLANGDGTFRAPSVYILPDSVITAIADIDGDGNQDIVAIPAPSSAFWVLPGNGDGTFGAPVGHTLSGSYTSLEIGRAHV